jgi:hypothetical protein
MNAKIFAEINVADLGLERDNTRGKALSTIEKFWLRLLFMDSLEVKERVMNGR